MALVQCPECGKEVSATAVSCPNCGYGVKKHFDDIENEKRTKEIAEQKKIKRQQTKDNINNSKETVKNVAKRSLPIVMKCIKIIFPCIVAVLLIIILTIKLIIPEITYHSAKNKYNLGEYEEAISIYKSISDYRDAQKQIENCKDAQKQQRYEEAVQLFENKRYSESYNIFKSIHGYKDVETYLSRSELLWYQTGCTVTFGKYEQDNNLDNGAENIDWTILEVQNDRVLIISKYCLDALPFNDTKSEKNLTWDECTLKKWLNGTFYNTSFNENEKERIIYSSIPSDKGYENTNDNVFILSKQEIERFFPNNNDRAVQGTEYAKRNKNLYVNADTGNASWWIRASTFLNGFGASAYCIGNGSLFTAGTIDHYAVYAKDIGIRPAMYVKLPN